jgi:hypothetical protein
MDCDAFSGISDTHPVTRSRCTEYLAQILESCDDESNLLPFLDPSNPILPQAISNAIQVLLIVPFYQYVT